MSSSKDFTTHSSPFDSSPQKKRFFIWFMLFLVFIFFGIFGIVEFEKRTEFEQIECNFINIGCIRQNVCDFIYSYDDCYSWNCESQYDLFLKSYQVYLVQNGITSYFNSKNECEEDCKTNGTTICYWNPSKPSVFQTNNSNPNDALWLVMIVFCSFITIFCFFCFVDALYRLKKIKTKNKESQKLLPYEINYTQEHLYPIIK